jgi:transposase
VINQIRGFLLEHGIAVRQGIRFLRQQLPDILAKRGDVLLPRMIRIIEDFSGDWRRLDERIQHITEEIEVLAHSSESFRQLMTAPGIGPLIASAMVAAIGNGATFAKGRDFAAWLGLVPKQMSTGDRTILGRISKRGNRYLRTLIMQGARVILLRPANWAKHSFGLWLTAAAQRLHHNVLATAHVGPDQTIGSNRGMAKSKVRTIRGKNPVGWSPPFDDLSHTSQRPHRSVRLGARRRDKECACRPP